MSNAATLLPPNATPVMRALEAGAARLADIEAEQLSTLWDAQGIRADYLPWLAWGFSVDGWNPAWPVSVRRDRTQQAIEVHRHKGTAKAVRDTVAAYGGAVSLREWWQMEPKGTPYTFELVMVLSGDDGEFATADYVNEVMAAVDQVKPERCHYTFTLGVNLRAPTGIAAAARPVTFARLSAFNFDEDNLAANNNLWQFAHFVLPQRVGLSS